MGKWTRAIYQPNKPLKGREYVTSCADHIALSRGAAAEGMVLLKNEDHALPFSYGEKIAVFGKALFDTVKGGGGSGDVYSSFNMTLDEGLRSVGADLFPGTEDYYREYVREQYEAGAMPGLMEEPVLDDKLVDEAASFCGTALLVLSRFSGEGWDRSVIDYKLDYSTWIHETTTPKIAAGIFPDSDFYLTQKEKALKEQVLARFDRVIVVLNTGGMMDTSWIRDDDRIGGALLMWQGGMAGGLAAANLLFGLETPSGRLPDTFAARLEDYPSTEHFHDSPYYVEYFEDIYVGYRYFLTLPGQIDRVVYPFGYGLSYTSFSEELIGVKEEEEGFSFTVKVTNTGACSGKNATAVYYGAPEGRLGKCARELGDFAKTGLLIPGGSEEVVLTVSKRQMASFDDLGKVWKYAWVLEKGKYCFFLGADVTKAVKLDYCWELADDMIMEQLDDKLAPAALEKRMLSDGSYEELPLREVPDKDACAFEKLKPEEVEAVFPQIYPRARHMGWLSQKEGVRVLLEVAEGRMTMDEFLAQLSVDDLIRLTGGTPNRGVANTCGFGGIEEYGIPAVMTADGPAGVRINEECGIPTTAWPCETLLASTWNTDIVRQIGRAAGAELKENNLQVWLAPAMNIHRNPVCGRNFEYYSEDPYLTGRMAGALVEGVQSNGVSACIKHFACNNKETNRKNSDSRVSLRALREIYLKAFEIVVKNSDPWTLMSSYNLVNGQRASESRDLLTGILREDWGYQGVVTTDWWTRAEHYKEILAGNDIKMATGFHERVRKAYEMGELTRKDLEICAGRVLALICRLD